MSPKTLTGEELQLDDAPARESELFLVDGNNLAYRAFFALPEELATSEGFSTNALLGFTNMLFKLLADYRPKGVAVAWDTRPVHRHELLDTYKIERKPMPGLLSEQFPFFRPIVEAFGYRNLEFEGWEADDELTPARSRAVKEHAEQARAAKELATMRRDLELDCDPAELVLAPPDRSQLKEMFRRFEFRNLLNRVDELDEAVPASAREVEGVAVPWREGELVGSGGFAADAERAALATEHEVLVGPRPERPEGR